MYLIKKIIGYLVINILNTFYPKKIISENLIRKNLRKVDESEDKKR